MHPSAWLQYNPFYDLFYGTTSIAVAVAIILALALLTALWRHNKHASIGLGVGLALAITSATVLSISDHRVDQGFDYNMASGHYGASVTGVTFIGTPIIMALAALALLGLAGKTAYNNGRPADRKLLLITTYLLGASLAGTFATSLTQDTFNVGGYYWNNWANLDAYLWAADFLLTCALALVALYAGGRYFHNNVTVRVIDTSDPAWRRVQFSGKKNLHRTAAATTTA